MSWPLTERPRDAQSDYPSLAQIFAYGAQIPESDADVHHEELFDMDDYAAQCLVEVASNLSISTEKNVLVAMTVARLR